MMHLLLISMIAPAIALALMLAAMGIARKMMRPLLNSEPPFKLSYSFDGWKDELTVEGIRYSGALFREFGGLMPCDTLFRLVKRDGDGMIWIEKLDPGSLARQIRRAAKQAGLPR